jgi:hypothetical protein
MSLLHQRLNPIFKTSSGVYFRCFTIAPQPPWAKCRRFLSNTHPARPLPPSTKLLIQASSNHERLNSLWHHLQDTFQTVCGRRVTNLISINCKNIMKKISLVRNNERGRSHTTQNVRWKFSRPPAHKKWHFLDVSLCSLLEGNCCLHLQDILV